MAANFDRVFAQAGSVEASLGQIIGNVQQTIAAIDRVNNVATDWAAQVAAGDLDASFAAGLDTLRTDLAELSTAITTYRDKHQPQA